MSDKPQYGAIDLMKFISAIVIVALHSSLFAGTGDAEYYFMCFARFAVPFFFTISSFLFWSLSRDIKRFSKRLLILYAVWLLIQSPIVIQRYFVEAENAFLHNLAVFIKNLIFNSTFTASWFIMGLLEAMLITWALRNHKKVLWIMSVVLYSLCISSSLYYGIVNNTCFGVVNRILSGHFPFANSFCAALLFVQVGRHFAENGVVIGKRSLWRLLAISVLLGILEVSLLRDTGWRITDAYVSLIPLSAVIAALTIKSSICISENAAKWMRNSSTILYVSHGLFLFIFGKLLGIPDGARLFGLTLGSCLILSGILISLSKKNEHLKYLY